MARYDFDLITLGAGSGGVRASRLAASLGKKVAVFEERYLGGTCVNVGCIPKKLLVYAAEFAEDFEDAVGFGWTVGERRIDWRSLVRRKGRGDRSPERRLSPAPRGVRRAYCRKSRLAGGSTHRAGRGPPLHRRDDPRGYRGLALEAANPRRGASHHLERRLPPRGAAGPRGDRRRRLHRGRVRRHLSRPRRSSHARTSRRPLPARLRRRPPCRARRGDAQARHRPPFRQERSNASSAHPPASGLR